MKDGDVFGLTIVGLFLLVAAMAWLAWDGERRDDCAQSGGHVVDVENQTRIVFREWVCER